MDDRTEIQLGQGVKARVHGQRVAELQRLHHRQVGLEKVREQLALHDVAGVGGAPLLGVLEALLQVPAELVPFAEFPDPPGVQALLLEEVPLAGVGQRGGRLAAVRAATDKGQRTDLVGADKGVPELRTGTGQQRHRQPGPVHERVRQRQRVEAALRRGLGDNGVAGQRLHELGMDLHRHRVVPGRDVADRPRQRTAAGDLPLDLAEVPPDPIKATVDIGARQPPRLADLPDQQQRERLPFGLHGLHRRQHPGLALVEVDPRPLPVHLRRLRDGSDGGLAIDPGRPLDDAAVNRGDVLADLANPLPLAADEVEDAVGVERLRSRGSSPRVDLGPGSSGLELQGHGDLRWRRDRAVGKSSIGAAGPQNRTLANVPTSPNPTFSYDRRAAVLKSLT